MNFEFIQQPLISCSSKLAKGPNVVSAFVNDELDIETLQELSNLKTNCVLLRCAGFKNVDLNAAKKFNIKVYRVLAYSPNAVT